jgi:pyridoxine 4-dehydrogenase
VPIVSVQNRYNLTDRGSEEMLEYCEWEGIYFILWFPLANRDLARPGSPVEEFARRKARRRPRSPSPGCSHTPR